MTIHVQVDNKVPLAYLLKMGGTRSPQLVKISKSIWNYLLSHQITITAEYPPSRLNVRADWESRNARDSSVWKLHQKVYLKITSSRSNCLQAASPTSSIYGMEARSKQFCNRCNAAGLEQNVWFCIPTLQLDWSGDKEGSSGKCRGNDTSDTHMEDTTLVFSFTKNVHTTSIAFTSPPKPITKSPGRKTSSCENDVPKVTRWKITGKTWKSKEFQAVQPNLSPCPGDQVQLQDMNRPVTSGLASVVDNKLIQFVRL